jgi:hypothetical protein
LDFDNAGYNPLLGEFANFSWYVYFLGGYLTPKLNKIAFVDHSNTFAYIKTNTPTITNFEISKTTKTILINYKFQPSSPRNHILKRYHDLLIRPTINSIQYQNWQTDFCKYLAMRILGVYNIFSLELSDQLFCFSKLLELQEGNFSYHDFFGLYEETKK